MRTLYLLSAVIFATAAAYHYTHVPHYHPTGPANGETETEDLSGSSRQKAQIYFWAYNGNVTQLHPTGMGSAYGGMAGSHLAIDQDIDAINKRKACYMQAGVSNGIPPAVIAAIASRESRGGKLLNKTNGWGDDHNAYGIMQCDINANPLQSIHKTCTSYNWDSCDHIKAMVKHVLAPNIQAVKRKHPSWSDAQALQGGVAAYNFGVGNVQSWSGLDVGSTHNDYSNDVIARAQYLISHYHW